MSIHRIIVDIVLCTVGGGIVLAALDICHKLQLFQ